MWGWKLTPNVLLSCILFRLIRASKKLHDDMTRSVLRAKIEFFDTNPIGRILNRFSSGERAYNIILFVPLLITSLTYCFHSRLDVGSNDDQLPTTLFDFLVISFLVVGALLSTVVVLPVTLVVVPPLIWYFLRIRNIFARTSRELKRLGKYMLCASLFFSSIELLLRLDFLINNPFISFESRRTCPLSHLRHVE